ncbi:MAG TPA: hypothetical protein VH855_16820 [Acetobacteraceae bacterium]
MSDNPDLPFGHNTLKLRAVFIPDGAQVSMSDIARVVGLNPVLIPAVLVPPGGAPPGYPYEIIGEATFIPDRSDRERPARTGPPWPGPPNDPAGPDNRVPRRARGSDAPMANVTGPWGPGRGVADSDQAPAVTRRRRGVRSAQANFSAAVPTPYLDTSHDTVGAAVNALSVRPTNWDYASARSLAASAIRSGTSLPPLQFPADLISASTDDRVGPSDARPSQLATDATRERQPRTPDITSPSSDQDVAVILPNGSTIADPYSATGHLMSPVADLAPVAAAGRNARRTYQTLLRNPRTRIAALPYLGIEALINVGHGGRFDYQRRGSYLTGFTQFRQCGDVADFNVGLFCQQAGLSVEETLIVAGQFARALSSNVKPDQPYGLGPRTAEFIKVGYQAGQRGAFDDPLQPR